MRTCVWFRRDLRTHDQLALSAASAMAKAGQSSCVAVYIACPADWHRHDDAPVKIDYTLRSLKVLSEDLQKLGIPLLLRIAKSPADVTAILRELITSHQITHLHAGIEYEVHEQSRDQRVSAMLAQIRCLITWHHTQVVIPPGQVRTKTDTPYTVFTPFRKAWTAKIESEQGRASFLTQPPSPTKLQLASSGLKPDPVPSAAELGFASPVNPSLWPAGEHAATARLAEFCDRAIHRYKADRDTPSIDGTAKLSHALAVGTISPRTCLLAAMHANQGKISSGSEGVQTWISELIWREFYRQLIVHFPHVSKSLAFKRATDAIRWHDDPALIEAWKQGQTGFPIVDAAMRQLAQMGWMHNRLRMITAMFFTKDLFQNWRIGEQHFMRSLIDGDLAQNNGGWQWSASTGTDAAPYFRIFNPASQSEKCDPKGAFIRQYVPELASVPLDFLHDPQQAPMHIRLKLDYPNPIIDRTKTKDRVIKAFRGLEPAGSKTPNEETSPSDEDA